MNSQVYMLIAAAAIMFSVIGGLSLLAHYYTLNGIKSKTVGDGNNLLHLVNKYMDLYREDNKNYSAKAKAEKYAKIISKTIISTDGNNAAMGQNAFFYDAAEGLLTSVILLIAEFLPPTIEDGKRVDKLPPTHKAKWFAGVALNSAEQAMASVLSTVLSRLNAFLDSEMEQILCFDTAIDAETFCNKKSAIFLILPEEDNTKYFMVSLFLQQFYREMLTVADENGGKLPNRVMIYADEIGTIPKIESFEMMLSAYNLRWFCAKL